MATAELAVEIAAPADRVWALLAGPDLLQVILDTYADRVDVEGEGVGTVLVTTLRGGGVIREQIEELDPVTRRLAYRLLDSGPLPYADYRGQLRVIPGAGNTCTVRLECSYTPAGMSEAESRRFWLEHNTEVFERISGYLAGAGVG